MGGGTSTCILASADLVADHPAAMREADAAAVDELVCDSHHGDDIGVDRRRRRDYDPYRAHHQCRRPHRPADSDLQLRAALVLPLLLSDRGVDEADGSTLR